MRPRRSRPFRFGLWLGAIGAAVWFVQRYQRSRVEAVHHAPSMPIARPEVVEVGDVEQPGEPEVGTVDVPPPAADAAVKKAVPAKKAAKKAAAPGRVAAGWVAPDDAGVCPPSHPVKAKMTSKLFHLPGMLAYARTKADRCYPDEAAAEADGLTKAKR